VGPPRQRQTLRDRLVAASDVDDEFASLPEGQYSAPIADAILLPAATAAPAVRDDLTAVEPLTPRELEVLELVTEGLPNKAIADRLGISDQTVKFHLASILGKLGASNRTDAVRRAVRLGIVTI
jgi:DNA-binding NarL/FixJ family response regulator